MARRKKLSTGKSPSGHPLKGSSPLSQGGPGFLGAKGSSKTTAAGSRSGGRKK
jgi:hypothetical protein